MRAIRKLPAFCLVVSLASWGEAVAQCAYDVCGYWYCENYNSGVQVEYLAIDLVGDMLVATKVLGDPYVPTGAVTWQGVPTACTFTGSVSATTGIGMPIVPLGATITIHSEDHIEVNTFGLQFYRTTVGYMDEMGVDYSAFPVSCYGCPFVFPNVFSPNGDGVNELLEPLCGIRSALFSVRDRWGRTVFETDGPVPSWDGRDQWDPCAPGIYFWSLIRADDRTGVIRHGSVTLLR